MALSNEALYANLTQAEITAGVTPTALTLGDFLIEVNFRMQITGPTMSGKSTFVLRLIQNRDKSSSLTLSESFTVVHQLHTRAFST